MSTRTSAVSFPTLAKSCGTRDDDDDLAGAGDDFPAPHPEAHGSSQHLEALLLERMDVEPARYPGTLRKLEVDRHELATRLSCRPAKRDPFPARRVHQNLSFVCHSRSPYAHGLTI
jgi:hypothetical protein